ncbi:reverse transcriptase domain-containing protein [Tanacetum coccineum]
MLKTVKDRKTAALSSGILSFSPYKEPQRAWTNSPTFISRARFLARNFSRHALNVLMEEDYEPSVQSQRRVNPKIHDVIKKEVEKLLDAGLIYPISDSPWVSPVHCVPKKGGMTVITNEENELIPTRLVTGWRVCIDYRKLNEATRKDHFPLPFMDQMLERLAGNEYYCFLDGFSGYFQIPIDPKDQEKTTFTCPYGTFAYRRMPFGLCNAPGTFQRCMMAIFHDMIEKTMEVFMDDFSVFGDSFSTCLTHLEKMLKLCEDHQLSLNWKRAISCRLITNIESLKDNPTPDRVLKSLSSFPIPIKESDSFFEKSDTSLSYSDKSLPEFETFSDDTEETRSGSTITHANKSLPEYDLFLFEIEPDQDELTNVVIEEVDTFLVPEDSIPSSIESNFDPGGGEIVLSPNVEDDDSFTFVIQTFLPFLTYPVDSPLLLSSGSEDTIFDPGIFT